MEHGNCITAFIKCAKSNKTDNEKKKKTSVKYNLKWPFK